MDAFDADVLIYAAIPGHDRGERVRALFATDEAYSGVGSLLLLPEVLTKPLANGQEAELDDLAVLLARLDLRSVDRAVAEASVVLGAKYGLRAADAVHLATAVTAGADRFITNNSRDLSRVVTETVITYPDELPPPRR